MINHIRQTAKLSFKVEGQDKDFALRPQSFKLFATPANFTAIQPLNKYEQYI